MVVLRFLHALHLRLLGLVLLALAAAPAIVARDTAALAALDPPLLVPGALGAALLLPWLLPSGLRRPARPRDLAWLAVSGVAAVTWHRLTGSITDDLSSIPPWAVAILQARVTPLLWLLPAAILTPALIFLPSRLQRSADAVRSDPEVAARRSTAQPERKLPALGAAMQLYVVADWTMLRAVGIGLMATAYLLWTLVEQGHAGQAMALAHGRDPVHAMVVYTCAGAILALPFLLPRRIARPRHVAFGLLKAVLIVSAAYALIGPLTVAIVAFTPDIYHPTLLQTVPRLFKAICGVAVTAALLLSFFRQLNGLPAVDHDGNPKVRMTRDQLHALRKARMPG